MTVARQRHNLGQTDALLAELDDLTAHLPGVDHHKRPSGDILDVLDRALALFYEPQQAISEDISAAESFSPLTPEKARELHDAYAGNFYKVAHGQLVAANIVYLGEENYASERRTKRAEAKLSVVEQMLRGANVWHPQEPRSPIKTILPEGETLTTAFRFLGGGRVRNITVLCLQKSLRLVGSGGSVEGREEQILAVNPEVGDKRLYQTGLPGKTVDFIRMFSKLELVDPSQDS